MNWSSMFVEYRTKFDGSEGAGQRGLPIYETLRDQVTKQARQVMYYPKDNWTVESGVLAHYTTLDAAISILKQDKPMLRMYNLETANDPLEGRAMPTEWEETVNGSELMRKYGKGDAKMNTCSSYGVCFTSGPKVGDSLLWWRLYGDNGRGCCFVVPAVAQDMYRVRYRRRGVGGKKEQEEEDTWVAGQLRDLVDAGHQVVADSSDEHRRHIGSMLVELVYQVLEGYSYLIKDVAYSEEKEWRQLRVRPTEEEVEYHVEQPMIRRYVRGPLLTCLLQSKSQITIGPRAVNRHGTCGYLRRLARGAGLRHTDIKVSEKPSQWPEPTAVALRLLLAASGLYWFIRREIHLAESRLGDRISDTNKRIDTTNERIDDTNDRTEETNDRTEETKTDLVKRIDDVKADLVKQIDDVKTEMRQGFDRMERLLLGMNQKQSGPG